MGLNEIFRRRKRKLYFALVVADRPTEGFEFKSDKDCRMFIVSGQTERGVVIPRTVLKEVVDRFEKPEAIRPLEGEVRVSEKES